MSDIKHDHYLWNECKVNVAMKKKLIINQRKSPSFRQTRGVNHEALLSVRILYLVESCLGWVRPAIMAATPESYISAEAIFFAFVFSTINLI